MGHSKWIGSVDLMTLRDMPPLFFNLKAVLLLEYLKSVVIFGGNVNDSSQNVYYLQRYLFSVTLTITQL